ncbi:MAG: hypothetical protein KAY22_23235 [Rhizorhabdus sp.]|nr:hypothetical protein [Rhizorhabdus sp.]
MVFLVYFDELVESFEQSRGGAEPMTEARAGAESFRIWQAAIEADDKARRIGPVFRVPPMRDARTTSCIPTANGGMNRMQL